MQEEDDEEAHETEEALEEAVFAAMSDKGTCTMSQLDLEEYAGQLQRARVLGVGVGIGLGVPNPSPYPYP